MKKNKLNKTWEYNLKLVIKFAVLFLFAIFCHKYLNLLFSLLTSCNFVTLTINEYFDKLFAINRKLISALETTENISFSSLSIFKISKDKAFSIFKYLNKNFINFSFTLLKGLLFLSLAVYFIVFIVIRYLIALIVKKIDNDDLYINYFNNSNFNDEKITIVDNLFISNCCLTC